jgi:hypothetical protein
VGLRSAAASIASRERAHLCRAQQPALSPHTRDTKLWLSAAGEDQLRSIRDVCPERRDNIEAVTAMKQVYVVENDHRDAASDGGSRRTSYGTHTRSRWRTRAFPSS